MFSYLSQEALTALFAISCTAGFSYEYVKTSTPARVSYTSVITASVNAEKWTHVQM